MNVLFAGETTADGPARYLLAILRHAKTKTEHVPCSQRLDARAMARGGHDVILLSDYPRNLASQAVQQAIAAHVRAGGGLLMIGGWSSFAAPFGGGWQGSVIESLLPVRCVPPDDRVNTPSGALVFATRRHVVLDGVDANYPPVICGFNRVRSKPGSTTILSARRLRATARGVHLASQRHPILVLSDPSRLRTAAFATDVSPHWCGGLVDWGSRRVGITVAPRVRVEVGDSYLRLFANLLHWLGGRRALA